MRQEPSPGPERPTSPRGRGDTATDIDCSILNPPFGKGGKCGAQGDFTKRVGSFNIVCRIVKDVHTLNTVRWSTPTQSEHKLHLDNAGPVWSPLTKGG